MKRKESTVRRPKSTEDKLKAIYTKSRREFTAADLQKFTVAERGIPLAEVIAEMQSIQRNSRAKKT